MYFTLNIVLLSLISMVHPITLCVMTVKCCLIVGNGFCMIFDLCYGGSSFSVERGFWLSSVFGKSYTLHVCQWEQQAEIWSRKFEMQYEVLFLVTRGNCLQNLPAVQLGTYKLINYRWWNNKRESHRHQRKSPKFACYGLFCLR